MSETSQEKPHIGLEFSRPGRLSIVEKNAGDFLRRVIDISKALDEGKEKLPIRTEPFPGEIPYELGPASTQGALRALEKVATSNNKDIETETSGRAAYVVAMLNETLGQNEDRTLIKRLAEAAFTKLNLPNTIFF